MAFTKEQMIKLYTNLVRVRTLDEIIIEALGKGKISAHWTSPEGQEAVGVGACTFLNKDDYIFFGHRGHGISTAIPKGLSPAALIAEHYSKATGCCRGMVGMHVADMSVGIPGMSGTLGGHFVLAAGMGITAQNRGKGQVVVCIEGDGCYGRGTFHESALMAANWKLPVVWVVENNQYMIFTPTEKIYPKENYADLAFGYGMPGEVVDGQDVVAVCEAITGAVERARAGEGPSMIECKTYRIRPHTCAMLDLKITEPRPQEEIDEWKKRDPIVLFRERLLAEGVLSKEDVDRINQEVGEEMAAAEKFADESPEPDPEILEPSIYAESPEVDL
jgi:acetoin:2,6-dichlorophenolindophenol oxidoreductase subunit alpha